MSSPNPASEPAAEMTSDQVVEAIYAFAAEQLHNGVRPADVERLLRDKGLEAETAQTVVANLCQARTKALREAGKKNMLYGALWCIGGTVVTVLTYQAAAGGGRYVVAWGAIIFGAIQFFRGMSQSHSR